MSEWKPIETAPKDGTPVSLTFFEDGEQGREYVGTWNDEQEAWETEAVLFKRGWFTHWMPSTPHPSLTRPQGFFRRPKKKPAHP